MHDLAGWLILGAAAIVGSTIGGVAGFGTGVIMIIFGLQFVLWPSR